MPDSDDISNPCLTNSSYRGYNAVMAFSAHVLRRAYGETFHGALQIHGRCPAIRMTFDDTKRRAQCGVIASLQRDLAIIAAVENTLH